MEAKGRGRLKVLEFQGGGGGVLRWWKLGRGMRRTELQYRVSQVSCNIKNRHISASKSSKKILKIDLWRFRFALFVIPNFNLNFWIVAGQKNIK